MREASPGFERLLMLQGPAGPFFRLLARRLCQHGVTVHKINFNGGDALFFPGRGARPFRGRPEAWPGFLENLLTKLDIDAIALFGDCRRHHKEAIEIAERLDIRVFVFEEGYLRPNHVTIELDGVNGHSKGRVARPVMVPAAGAPDVPVGNSFPAMSFWATLYWAAIDLGRPAYPHYRHHRASSIVEAFAYLRSGLRKLRSKRWDRKITDRLIDNGAPYFLLPLQVRYDSQITEHSSFACVTELIGTTVRSFARHAPANATLVIKHHPLDRGHCNYRDAIAKIAAANGCAERIAYILDGHLPTLLTHARGTITCNSTVGLSSLWHGTPVKVLGQAVYDRPGLTSQIPLDRFWKAALPVDRQAVSAYIEFLKATCLANGNFYTAYKQTRIFDGVLARMAELGRYDIRGSRGVKKPHAAERPNAGKKIAPVRPSPPKRKSGTD